jgi:hypothetical protein
VSQVDKRLILSSYTWYFVPLSLFFILPASPKITTLGLSSPDVTLDSWRKADRLLVAVSREERKRADKRYCQ